MISKKITKSIQSFFKIWGYKIIPLDDKNKGDNVINAEFEEIYEECKEFTMTSIERMYALHKAVEYIVKAKIPGDFVECGVWRGGSAMIMTYTLLQMKEINRKIYLYDTYEGMSEPTREDKKISSDTLAVDKWKSKQKEQHNEWCFASLKEVKSNLFSTGYPKKNLVFLKGKVENTIPKIMPSKIALLRLDTDWYESTKHELKHLFPVLTKHGVLILDDYGSWAGAKKAVDEYFKNKSILLNRIDSTGRVGIKTE
ncbi:macrocin O-methyltransferase [Candidatus Berkelbacteria bacterium CG10_big_fil_rev_8_21_14_0_10_41_12]|uniref:Macrocin O-methyltransferase n=1 Tax=Candidatus Berkelbacteria bacterium CG10_big_fil_rev_8_21_14_0_10_41_12 TaxID=1974513 RepID=A0A2M6WY37_9BACT|nr:MAG: macrocin O-methyltransferase [Candidatus Berkelbacteria bacterium CG10_big_fil_rev_8_21_14_0_10_41_12]